MNIPRAFYTSMPLVLIWNTDETPALQSIIRFSEPDNQPPVKFHPTPEYQVPDIHDADGLITEYLLGYRVAGQVNFEVWPTEYCTEHRGLSALQVTEVEIAQILDAKMKGWHVQFYQHADQCTGVYDAMRDVKVVECYADRAGLAQYPCAGVFSFIFINLIKTSQDIWTYLASL